jgi:hypothetical protein
MSLPNPADPPRVDPVAPMQTACRLCRKPMRSDLLFCPECSTPVRRYHFAPANATVLDYFLAVGSALLALSVTLPLTVMLIRGIGANAPGSAEAIIGVAIWNGWFLGIPVVACGRRWVWRIRRGEFDHRLIWREYWQMQCAALIPVFLFLSCMAISYLWAGFQWLLGSSGLKDLS